MKLPISDAEQSRIKRLDNGSVDPDTKSFKMPLSYHQCSAQCAIQQGTILMHVLVFVAAFTSMLSVGTVSATVTLEFDESHFNKTIKATPEADPNTGTGAAYWTNYSSNCMNVVGGTTCGVNPRPNPDTMLFSWGRKEIGTSGNNSLLEATYTGAEATLFAVTLSSQENLLGPANGPSISFGGPPYNPQVDPVTGAGSMVAYEQPPGQPNTALITQFSQEQLVSISKINQLGTETTIIQDALMLPNATSRYYTISPSGNSAIAQFDFSNDYDMGGIALETGDKIRFRFYEAIWNNSTVGNVAFGNFPDAYYGSIDLKIDAELKSTPLIAVTDTAFGNVRAGAGEVVDAMTVTNTADPGAPDLNGQFEAINDANPFGGPYGTDSFAGLIAGDPNSFATREFTFNPGLLTDDDTTGREYSLDQPVSSSNAPNSPQNGKVTGTTVGPLGQAERKGNPIANSPDQEPIQVNLGSIELNGELIDEWAMRNLFENDLGTSLTNLTLLNIGFHQDEKGDGNPDLFSIGGFNAGTQVIAGSSSPFDILFTSSAAGSFFAILQIETDQNAEHLSNGRVFSYRLDVTVVAAPIPTTLALLVTGLFGLRIFRASIHR